MFESPFKSDFDFGTEFGSSTQQPFSLRSRLREVRDAFRGFRSSPSAISHNESKLPTVPLRRASDTATSSIESSSAASALMKKPVKEIEVSIQFLHEVIRTDMFEVLIGSTNALFDSVLSYISTLKYPVPHVQESSSAASALMKKPVKEIEVSIQFLHEVIRTDMFEVLIGSTNALFDSVLSYISTLKYPVPHVQDALIALLDWIENKILSSTIYDDHDTVTELENWENDRSEGARLANELLKAIMEINEKPSSKPSNINLFEFHEGHHNTSVAPNNSSFHSISSADTSSSLNHSSENVGIIDVSSMDQSLDDLLAQLNLHQVTKFVPIFPQVENEDSDEDDFDIIHEKREEREEKKDTKTCEEEVQRLSDGSEIRTRKTRTFNMQQNSKQVTVRSHGNGGDEIVNTFHDGNTSFNDDLATDDFFTKPRNSFRYNRLDGVKCLDDLLKTTDNATNSDEGISQKIKSVQHTNTVSQKVSKTAKKNGKIIADDAAQKIDKSELNARQVETFKDVELLDRRGSGSYEEHSTVKMGLTKSSSSPPIPPKQRHVIQYMQTFGNKSEDQDDFFKGSTLASYILLNDNLRYHEEQYKKRISFEFSLSRVAVSNQNFSDLSQLLQYTETDRIMLPKRYMDENDVAKGTTSLACSEAPEILECIDVTDWLMLRAHDALSKPNEVRGGPKDALIAFATQPSGSLLYQEAFLTTYRSFVKSDELIQKLIKRYLYMYSIKERQSIKVARQTFSMLVRVVDELCAVEQTRKLIRLITKFISRLVKDENYTFARILRQLTIFDIRSAIIAKQMTYLDAELFHMIEPAEMLWWAQEQNEKKSPNLCRFTEHFNKVSYWVRTLVLTPCEQRTREKVMSKFVKIMKHLRIVGNYNSYLAILSALDSGPIRRLDWSKHITDLLKEHSVVMDSSHSFRNYRTLLSESRPPCLPYIGLVLQDLTFVHIGNSDYLPPEQCNGRKNLINYGKRWQQFAILDSIRCFKSWNYSIEKDEKVIQFFNGFNNYLSEDEIWDLSESIKPRTRKNK
ncbi:rap guanine nucleotide exchange factor 1 [Loa loa]|uniref:Rap guanine nucleotide exchange factor 1 n=1 Tax=Loa loa TaxID=7209 RepID=A0A1S0UJ80_LOALO|nr:rap guanine nucleotide exchange factor 1 [Loa loa]EJD74874.1 rap guanine nucleotide exchange factor 1 [Loa loa]